MIVSLKSSLCLPTTKIMYFLAVISLPARGTFGGPNDTFRQLQHGYAGQNVTLPCHTNLDSNVDWLYQSHPTSVLSYVYSNGVFNLPYRHRFTIDSPTKGDFNLVIADVRLGDAGQYICVEDDGYGPRHTVELIVSEGGPSEVPSTVAATVNAESTVSATSTAGVTVNKETTVSATSMVAVVVGVIVFVVVVSTTVFVVVLLIRRNQDSKDEGAEKESPAQKTNKFQRHGDETSAHLPHYHAKQSGYSELVHSPETVRRSVNIESETATEANPESSRDTTQC